MRGMPAALPRLIAAEIPGIFIFGQVFCAVDSITTHIHSDQQCWTNISPSTRQHIISELVELCASGLNVFPAVGGILSYHSSEALMTGKVVLYNKHCKFDFGEY